MDEIILYLKLNPSKSRGADHPSPRVLKEVSRETATLLLKVFHNL